jgi:hypothetical protein
MMEEKRKVQILFVKEYKSFIQAFKKKGKQDYILNVSKIIKDKFNTKFIVPNKVQSFLLNYEIRKLLDKALTIKNKKYTRVIYLNSQLTYSSIENAILFIGSEYENLDLEFLIIKSKNLDPDDIPNNKVLKILQVD